MKEEKGHEKGHEKGKGSESKKGGKPSEKSNISYKKAAKMLKEGVAHGKPLSGKQKGMMGAIVGKGEK